MDKVREAVRRAWDVCPIEVAVSVAGGDWKLTIVSKLADGAVRFGELQRRVGPVSAKTLTRQLRALEQDEVLVRTVYPEVPPRVTYELTAAGHALADIAIDLGAWSERFIARAEPLVD